MSNEGALICEHGEVQPWATCIDCMQLPEHQRPKPPAAQPIWPLLSASDVDYVVVYAGGAWHLQGKGFETLFNALFEGSGVASAFDEKQLQAQSRAAERLRLFPTEYVVIGVGSTSLVCDLNEIWACPRIRLQHEQADAAAVVARAIERSSESIPLEEVEYRKVEGRPFGT